MALEDAAGAIPLATGLWCFGMYYDGMARKVRGIALECLVRFDEGMSIRIYRLLSVDLRI